MNDATWNCSPQRSFKGLTLLSTKRRVTCVTAKKAWGQWENAAGRSISKSHLLLYCCLDWQALEVSHVWSGFATGSLHIAASAPPSGETRIWAAPHIGTGGRVKSNRPGGQSADLKWQLQCNFWHKLKEIQLTYYTSLVWLGEPSSMGAWASRRVVSVGWSYFNICARSCNSRTGNIAWNM